MPIYAYRCASCGFQKDFLQKISDPQFTTCPDCGKESFKKQLTAAGFQLKGSGWYSTDFKGGNSTGKSEGKSEGGDSKSSDSGKPLQSVAHSCAGGACACS